MKLSLTVQTPEVPVAVPVALLSGTFDEKLRKAAELGAGGVELVTTEPASLDPAWIQSLLNTNHLGISGVASGAMAFAAKLTLLNPDPAVGATARRRLDELIELAAALGAPLVTVGSFRGKIQGDRDRSIQKLAGILHSAGDLAAQRNVVLVVEPLNRFESDLINNVGQGLEFLKIVDHPAVGLLIDTFHANIEEASWTEPFHQAAAAGKLFHVHLGDNNRLAPGKGLIDFRAILRTLRAVGYDRWLTAELLAQPDPDAAARDTVDTITALLKEGL